MYGVDHQQDLPRKLVQDTIQSWAFNETAIWKFNPINLSTAIERWSYYNATNPSIFLFNIAHNKSTIIEKPTSLASTPHALTRAEKYRDFFHSLSASLPVNYEATLAVGVADKLGFIPDVPIFCFQKEEGANSILLPDIEFLLTNFYSSTALRDSMLFADKVHKAVFVGGTSGGMITPQIARACTLPRLRAAQFFHGHDNVEFTLPRIVQCVNDEARQTLEKMPFCQQPTRSWKDQLTRRFIISMDGNGATCSRVVVTLKSNSVLLKYCSNDVLYYFRGLTPWLHYVPIREDRDIEKVLSPDLDLENIFNDIARQSRVFAESYLTREAVSTYTQRLLLLYAGCFLSDSARQ